MKFLKKTTLISTVIVLSAINLAAQVDFSGAVNSVRDIKNQVAGIVGGVIGLIALGRCAYKFSQGDTGAVTSLLEAVAAVVLGQIAANM